MSPNNKPTTPVSGRISSTKSEQSGSPSVASSATPQLDRMSLQSLATDTTAGSSRPSKLDTGLGRRLNFLDQSSHTSPASRQSMGANQSSLAHRPQAHQQSRYNNDNSDSLFVSPGPEQVVAPSTGRAKIVELSPSPGPNRHSSHGTSSPSPATSRRWPTRPMMGNVARFGYYEDRFNAYPDVDENAEGGGIWCEGSDDDDDDEPPVIAHGLRRRAPGVGPSQSTNTTTPSHGGTVDMNGRKGPVSPKPASKRGDGRSVGQGVGDGGTDDETAAAEFAQSKAIYDAKVTAGTAKNEDFIWISGLEADEKERLKKVEEDKQKKEAKKAIARRQVSQLFEKTPENSDTDEESATPRQTPSKYGMFSKVTIPSPSSTKKTPSSTKKYDQSTTSPNSATASGVTRSLRRRQDREPTTPSHDQTSLGTPSHSSLDTSFDEDLSFGVIYQVSKDTNEVLIPASHVTNMALAHHRTGALPITKMTVPSTPAPSRGTGTANEEDVSMGIVYRIHPDTGEVMIPALHARNMILVHQRSGALTLSPGSNLSLPKRRKVGGDQGDNSSPSQAALRGRSRTRRGGGAVAGGTGRPRGRPPGSANKKKRGGGGGASSGRSVGSSISDPLEIEDDDDGTNDDE